MHLEAIFTDFDSGTGRTDAKAAASGGRKVRS
jgi:hypothetical protein